MNGRRNLTRSGLNILEGEVWFVRFPLEEDDTQFLKRPVVVLNVEPLEVLSIKVTKTEPRDNDDYDLPILYWQQANLDYKSTARISKVMPLKKTQFIRKIGDLHSVDLTAIQNMFMKFVLESK